MKCENCQAEIAPTESICPHCQHQLAIHAEIVQAEIGDNPYASPLATSEIQHPIQSEGDSTGGLIPYKNPKALIAYYLGLLSLFPLFGFPIGIAAFTLGILGLRDRKRNPVIKGSAHAWIGIGCGGLFAIIWGLAVLMMIIGLLSEQ